MDDRFRLLVQKYLDKSLTKAENAEFKKYLGNPECRKYLRQAEQIEQALKDYCRDLPEIREVEELFRDYDKNKVSQKTRDTVEQWRQDSLVREKKVRIARIGIAALAAVVVAGLFFAWLKSQDADPKKIFKQFYMPYEFIVMRSAPEAKEAFNRAAAAYNIAAYAESAGMCREIMAEGNCDPDCHFLYGLNLLELDSAQKAVQQFQTAATSPGISEKFYLNISVHWYASLCYLRLEKPDSALIMLEKISGVEKGYLKGVDVEGVRERIEK